MRFSPSYYAWADLLNPFQVPPHANSLPPGLSPSARDVGHLMSMSKDFGRACGVNTRGGPWCGRPMRYEENWPCLLLPLTNIENTPGHEQPTHTPHKTCQSPMMLTDCPILNSHPGACYLFTCMPAWTVTVMQAQSAYSALRYAQAQCR